MPERATKREAAAAKRRGDKSDAGGGLRGRRNAAQAVTKARFDVQKAGHRDWAFQST